MSSLNTTDYLVIAAYLLVLVGLGFYFRKRASKSLEDYFLGGKQLPWWAMGRKAAEILIEKLKHPNRPLTQIRLNAKLVLPNGNGEYSMED
jgi:hypothetical protein